ncbi:hypothetical protein ME792_09290 [Lactobacillus delbrueckii]|nr:hypothetical protein ME792_09290 [Lactobacillus delbrueckii]
MIVCLRHSGITVEALVDYVKLIEQGDSTLQAREDLLKEQLALLETKKKNFADCKIKLNTVPIQ